MRQVVCPVMVGRQRELELAEALLETALGGRGQLLVVSGEAGVGKSRLALAIASRGAERGATVLTGACLEQLAALLAGRRARPRSPVRIATRRSYRAPSSH